MIIMILVYRKVEMNYTQTFNSDFTVYSPLDAFWMFNSLEGGEASF